MRQTQLLLVVHAASGRLFPVAQRGVENGNADLLSMGFFGMDVGFLYGMGWEV